MPRAARGYWIVLSPAEPQLIQCQPEAACPGADLVAAANASIACVLSRLHNDSDGAACPAELQGRSLLLSPGTQCAPGYSGERCSQCAVRHYRLKGACTPCADSVWVTVSVAVAAVVFLLGGAVLLTRLKLSLAPLTIAVDFFQILGRQAGIDAEWSLPALSALRWSALVDFDLQFAAPECVVKVSYLQTWGSVIATPLLGMLAIVLGRAVMLVAARRSVERRRHHLSRMLSDVLLLLQLMYMVLVTKVMEAFDCREVATGVWVLEAEASIQCWQPGDHSVLLTVGSFAFVGYVLCIPLLFVLVLSRARRGSSDVLDWQSAVVPLSERFKGSHSRWILVVMARKALIATVVIMQSSRPGLQLACTGCVLAVGLYMQGLARPYHPQGMVQRSERAVVEEMLRHAQRRRGLQRSSASSMLTSGSSPKSPGSRGVRGHRSRLQHPRASTRLLDPNFMEETSLVASLLVITFGMTYLAADRAAADDVPLQSWMLRALDMVTLIVLALSAVYMMGMIALTTWLSRVVASQATQWKRSSGRSRKAAIRPGHQPPQGVEGPAGAQVTADTPKSAPAGRTSRRKRSKGRRRKDERHSGYSESELDRDRGPGKARSEADGDGRNRRRGRQQHRGERDHIDGPEDEAAGSMLLVGDSAGPRARRSKSKSRSRSRARRQRQLAATTPTPIPALSSGARVPGSRIGLG